jgi:hypothetical protein
MQELFIYLFKSSGLLTAFYLAYHFLFRKETFFKSNRWFLLSGLFVSASLPLFFIKKIVFVKKTKLAVNEVLANAIDTTTTSKVASINWIEIIAIGYIAVVSILIIKIIVNLISLFRLLNKKKIERHNNFALVNINEDIAPFSFFNFIVFNSSLYSNEELDSILLHEKVHSQQMHSFDVIFVKLFCIVFWFNPFVWLYKKAILQNLEYIADNEAIQFIEDKKVYQKTLLKVVSHQNCFPITNNFYQSLIKKRILMLNTNQSDKKKIWKYTIIIPPLIAFVFLFQIKVVAQEILSTNNLVEVNSVGWVTKKTTTDQEINEDIKTLKEMYNIDYNFSNVKRNETGEIIAIRISFNDNNGNQGEIKIDRNTPIEPIYFSVNKDKNGKIKAGFDEYKSDLYNISPSKLKTISKITEKDTVFLVNTKKEQKIKVNDDQPNNQSLPYRIYLDNNKEEIDNLKLYNTTTIYYIDKVENTSKIKKDQREVNDATTIYINDKVISKKEKDNIENTIIVSSDNDDKKKLTTIICKEVISDSKLFELKKSQFDFEQAKKDFEQAKKNLEQAKKDIKEAKRNIEKTQKS